MTPNELFFKLTKWQRVLIVIAVCILLAVAFYFLQVADDLRAIKRLENKIESVQKEIRTQEKRKKKAPQLKAKIEAKKKELQQMVRSLPEKQEIEILLQRITELLSETNLVASRFAPGKENVNEELYYAEIPITINVRGDYQKLGTFLASLNRLPRIVNVPRIRLSKAGALSQREQNIIKRFDLVALEAAIDGKTYRRLSQKEIQAIQAKKKGGKKKRGRRR